MAEVVVAEENFQLDVMHRKRRLYLDFLRLNYRVFDRYVQIKEIFSFSYAKTHSEWISEQRQLEGVNNMLTNLKTIILNLEKKSEHLLYSD